MAEMKKKEETTEAAQVKHNSSATPEAEGENEETAAPSVDTGKVKEKEKKAKKGDKGKNAKKSKKSKKKNS